jgi:DNA-binding MurR/RpiR family transcriptional regulator
MQNIQQKIIEKVPEYSRNQKQLANFILENIQTIPLLSVNDVAEAAKVSSATVVRFTRVLGYNGYMEFRNQLMELLKEQLSPLEKYKKTLSEKDQLQNSLERVSQTVIENINHSLEQNSLDNFKHIVHHIRSSDNIFCMGMGISHYLAEILAYLLKLYMKKAFVLSSDSPSFPEQIILLNPGDLLFVFSFPPYSRPTVDAARQAQEDGIPVISFTDKKTAPVSEFSEHLLVARTDNILFTNSLGAISVLMNALVTEPLHQFQPCVPCAGIKCCLGLPDALIQLVNDLA